MARKRSITGVVCQNPGCDHHFETHGSDIVKRGKDAKSGQQRYYCKHCRKTFYVVNEISISRPKCIDDEEFVEVLGMIRRSYTMRRIAQDTKHHIDTIKKLLDTLQDQNQELQSFMSDILKFSNDDCNDIIKFINDRKYPRFTTIFESSVKSTANRRSWYYRSDLYGKRNRGRPRKKLGFDEFCS